MYMLHIMRLLGIWLKKQNNAKEFIIDLIINCLIELFTNYNKK